MATLAGDMLRPAAARGEIFLPPATPRRVPVAPPVAPPRRPMREPVVLAVDLGSAIGSARWWAGLLLLAGLVSLAGWAGWRVIPLEGASALAPAPAVVAERRALGLGAMAEGSPAGVRLPPGPLVVPLAEIPERPRIELEARVSARGGLEAALRRAGVGAEDLAAVHELVGPLARAVPAGTALPLVLGRRESRAVPRPLESLALRAAFDLRLEIERGAEGALALRSVPIAVDDTPLLVSGEVGGSLYRSARAAGIPSALVSDYIRQMSYVLDFQREVRGRDRFEMIVEHRRAETGEVEMGRLVYAGLAQRGREVRLMRWGARGEFFRESGEGARRGLIRTPVDGARISSNFGMRTHPILGFSRMHQGMDFAAPTGTPVMAAAAGRVVQAGWGGGYGNLITIQHANGLRTRYGHLSRVLVAVGQQVGQGERVGLVGSTGLSTGPHLHYEVWLNGRPVDPRSANLPTGQQLGGVELSRFKAEMDHVLRRARPSVRLAAAETPPDA